MRLEDKVAIVTGGGRGIGQGIVHYLAEEGADVAVVDLNGETAATVADEVRDMGRRSLAVQADVTDSEQVARVVQETMDTFGKVVNIGSWLGHRPGNIHLFAYSVAKAAVLHFTRLLATELAEYNINVNCVCPGDVLTPATQRGFELRIQSSPELAGKTPHELFTEMIKPRTALKRLQTPEDMGRTVAFLVSEDARNITGHILFVDGGQVMP